MNRKSHILAYTISSRINTYNLIWLHFRTCAYVWVCSLFCLFVFFSFFSRLNVGDEEKEKEMFALTCRLQCGWPIWRVHVAFAERRTKSILTCPVQSYNVHWFAVLADVVWFWQLLWFRFTHMQVTCGNILCVCVCLMFVFEYVHHHHAEVYSISI